MPLPRHAPVALGGSSYAALRISSRQIVDNSVRSKVLRNNDVRSVDVRNGSLLAKDFQPGGLPSGPPGRSALSPLRTGETIRGAWGLVGDVSGGNSQAAAITFPIPAPQPVDSKHVVVAANDTFTGDGCTGSATAPMAGRGFVCIYTAVAVSTNAAGGYGARASYLDTVATGDGSLYGSRWR